MSDRALNARTPGVTVSLRAYVTGVMLVALVPLLAHAVFATWLSYASTRQWAERDLMGDVEHLARDIDLQLDDPRMVMRLVATSPAAQRGDLGAMREDIVHARSQGSIEAALVRDAQGGVVFAVGVSEAALAGTAAAPSEQFLVSRMAGKPVLVAAWPMQSSDPGLARLEFMVGVDRLSMPDGRAALWPWHMIALADRRGRIAWSDVQNSGSMLAPSIGNPGVVSGVVHDVVAPNGDLLAHAFARAPRSGLTVVIGQPMPSLYGRVPLGPIGAIAAVLAVVLASLVLARKGAFHIHAAYRGALGGKGAGRIRIDDAVRLADDLRQRRDRLFQAAGGIAVLELSRPPGRPWSEAHVMASPNLGALLGHAAGTTPTLESLTRGLLEEDRAAITAMLGGIDVDVRALTRLIRIERAGEPVRSINMVGMQRDRIAGLDDELILMLQDVTAQKETEEELRAQAARLQLATEVAQLGVWDRDEQRGVEHASARLWEIVGRAPCDTLDMAAFLRMVHAEDRERVGRAIASADLAQAGTGPAEPLRYRIVRPDGDVRHVRSSQVFGHDAGHGIARAVGVLIDETETVVAQRALEASEARFRLAVETAELGVAELDLATGRGEWNDRLFRICGLEPHAERPVLPDVLALIHPEDRAAVADAVQQQQAGEAGNVVEYEFRLVRPDREQRIVHVRSGLLRRADGSLALHTVTQDVTEQRGALRRLADSELRLRLAVDAAGLGIWDHDTRTGRIFWSERMWRIRGLAPSMDGPTPAQTLQGVLPEDRAALLQSWRQMETGDQEIAYEYRVRWSDGSIRTVSGLGQRVRDASGAVVRIVGVASDITERRAAELAVRERTTTLELAIGTAGLGVWVRAPGETTRHGSARMWEMFGQPGREGAMTRDELLAALHPDDRDAVLREWVQADGEPAPRHREFRAVWPDGTTRHVLSSRAVLRDAGGRVLRVIGMLADVTEARRATEALTASEARLRLAVEAAELGVFDYDPDTREGYWSDRTWRLRGLEPRAGIPTREEVAATLHPDDRRRSMDKVQLQYTAPDGTRIDDAFRVVWPDGTVRHLQMRALVLRTASGRARVFGVNMDVTERREAALALEESEARLRMASEVAELGVLQVNMPEVAGYWSERMWRIRGWQPRPGLPSAEEALAVVHPNDRARVRAGMVSGGRRQPGDVARLNYRIVRPDGAIRHILSQTIVMGGQAEGRWTMIGVNADVTEQVEREQMLRDSIARFELAIDAAQLAVWDWDPATNDMTWSARMGDMVGMAPSEPVPTREEQRRLVHPDDLLGVPSEWIHGTRTDEERRGEGEFRVMRRDGAIRHLHWYGIPLRNSEGQVIRFAGVVADVTEPRLAELALRNSEELFRMASEAAEQGVWDHDLDFDKLTWSPRLWRIHGLAPADDAPTRAERIAMIHPEDRTKVFDLRQKLMAAPPHAVDRRSYRIVRPDGVVRTVERRAMLVPGRDGRPTRIVGVIDDVTEARELTAQAMTADKLATLGEMAGAIAHELAQPLQTMLATAAASRMRLANGADDATVQGVCERLSWIERQTSRAGKTIQHVLAFSRGESSGGVTHLAQAVEGAMELVGNGMERAGITVKIDVPDDLAPVPGGQIEIEQVLVNLLNNARDVIGQRDVRKIGIVARSERGVVSLDVTDTGGGVPADSMERIFQPFYTTKPVGKGTGIGLLVARRTMEALGGTITVSNGPLGACFSLGFAPPIAGSDLPDWQRSEAPQPV